MVRALGRRFEGGRGGRGTDEKVEEKGGEGDGKVV